MVERQSRTTRYCGEELMAALKSFCYRVLIFLLGHVVGDSRVYYTSEFLLIFY